MLPTTTIGLRMVRRCLRGFGAPAYHHHGQVACRSVNFSSPNACLPAKPHANLSGVFRTTPGWRNGIRGRLKICCPSRGMWVRPPPRALLYALDFALVNSLLGLVYLWCT